MPRFDDEPDKWSKTVPDLAPVKPAPKAEPAKTIADRKPIKDEPPDPRGSLATRFVGALLMTALLAGGVWIYFTLATQSELKETLPLPQALKVTSAAHGDLVRVVREYEELALDAGRSLRGVGKGFAAAAKRAGDRLDVLRKASRALEPQLTRDESRAIICVDNGAKFLQAFITSTANGGPSHSADQLELAKAQFRRALEIAAGKPVDELFVGKVKRAVSKGGGASRLEQAYDQVEEVQGAGQNLRLGE